MAQQKNKLTIVITLAVVSVLLLGGVSFTFFPAQTQPKSPLQIIAPSNSIDVSFLPGANSLFRPENSTSTFWVSPNNPNYTFIVYSEKPLDSIVIERDGSVNSSAPIKRTGNTYTFTGDIVNQTLIIQASNIVIDGANHALCGFNNGNAWALENLHLENVTGITLENLKISLSWQGVWIQNCADVTIQNCTLTNITNGIEVNSANSTTITQNIFENVSLPILYNGWSGPNPCFNNIVSKNTINNAVSGIQMVHAYSNKVSDNVLSNILSVGIDADNSSIVSGNILVNGTAAIGITVDSDCTITQNTISNFGSGLQLAGVDSEIYENTIENCSQVAAMSGSTDSYPLGGNVAYHNNFLNNTQPLLLLNNASSSINRWDNGKEGNCWSSYNGTDTDRDGLGDSPFQAGSNNTDSYPLMQPFVAVVNSYDHGTAQLFFTLAGVVASGGVFVALTWFYFGKRTSKKKLSPLRKL